jgi:chromosome segregation ATPase
MPLEQIKKLKQIVENLEEIQYSHIELDEIKDKKVEWSLEKFNHKLHTLSNLYMAMEEKINEIAEFTSQLTSDIDDLRESIKSLSNRSNSDSETTL